MSKTHEVTASGGASASLVGTPKARIVRNLAMTPEADEFLADLARRMGLSEGNVLRLALGMLKTAVDAREQGQHVGVTGNSDDLDVELVGF
jgi:hypothetical protein